MITNISEFTEASDEPGSLLQRLINLQSFEGSWSDISDALCDEMHIDRDAVRRTVNDLVKASNQTLDKNLAQQVLITAIIVVYLEGKLEDEMGTWELVVEKARAWFENAVVGDVLEKVWELAKRVAGM